MCLGERIVALYRVGREKAVLAKLKLLQSFPSADAASFSVDSDLTADGSLTFAEQADEGDDLIIQWLALRRGAVCVQSTDCKIRETVKIGRYEYRSASGAIVSVRDISAFFLDKQMPLGSSGAPIYHAGSDKILGFVHGNAAENDSFAICLDSKPIWETASLERERALVRQARCCCEMFVARARARPRARNAGRERVLPPSDRPAGNSPCGVCGANPRAGAGQ
jgi:hypothetical protein